MKKYIDKDALLAEIEKLEKALKNACNPNPFGSMEECMTAAELQALGVVKETINTLEVKEGVAKEGVVTSDSYIKFSDDTCVDYDPSMQMHPAFKGLRFGDKVKVFVTKE